MEMKEMEGNGMKWKRKLIIFFGESIMEIHENPWTIYENATRWAEPQKYSISPPTKHVNFWYKSPTAFIYYYEKPARRLSGSLSLARDNNKHF